jgi:biotin operon repressor
MKNLKDILKKQYGDGPQDIVLHGADLATQMGYTNVPNHVLYDGNLSSHAKLVYTMLLSYAYTRNHVFPGQERLARQCGMSSRSVWQAIRELDKSGFITVIRRGQGRTNLYVLHFRHVSKQKTDSQKLSTIES